MNAQRLKATMVLQRINGERLASAIGISESSFYRKMNGQTEFTTKEVNAIANTLGLGRDEVFTIFFDEQVS